MAETAGTWAARRPRLALAAFGRATFDLELAQAVLARSRAALEALPCDLVAASTLLTDPEAAGAFGAEAVARGADAVVCQFTTFVDARFIAALAEACPAPLLLWSLHEPGRPGERLSLNSLTGANLAGRELGQRRRYFRFVLGDPGEAAVGRRALGLARAAAAWHWMQGFGVLVVGDAPGGFYFCDPSPEAVAAAGLRLEKLPLDELFARARAVDPADWQAAVGAVRTQVAGLDRLAPEQVEGFGRLQVAIEGAVAERGVQAVAVRCWPEFFSDYGAAACSFVSALNERGVAAACEADVLGSLTMGLLGRLAGSPPYLGDLAAVESERDAAVFWHCGAGAFSLAHPATGAAAGVQPNRRIGFTLEFALRPGRVTIARLGERAGALRLLVGGGEALDVPQRFLGTAGVVRFDGEETVEARVTRLIEAGWEPHFGLVYGDVREELRDLAGVAGLPLEHA